MLGLEKAPAKDQKQNLLLQIGTLILSTLRKSQGFGTQQ